MRPKVDHSRSRTTGDGSLCFLEVQDPLAGCQLVVTVSDCLHVPSALGHDSPLSAMDPQVGSTAESRPWSETIAAESAFLGSFGHAAPTAGKATWCQFRTLEKYDQDNCQSVTGICSCRQNEIIMNGEAPSVSSFVLWGGVRPVTSISIWYRRPTRAFELIGGSRRPHDPRLDVQTNDAAVRHHGLDGIWTSFVTARITPVGLRGGRIVTGHKAQPDAIIDR